MSSSAITTQVAQLKAGNIQNQADSSSIYSAGVWSFKNSTAVASVTISDAGSVGIGTASPRSIIEVSTASETNVAVFGRNGLAQQTIQTDGTINLLGGQADGNGPSIVFNHQNVSNGSSTGKGARIVGFRVDSGSGRAMGIDFKYADGAGVTQQGMRIDASWRLGINLSPDTNVQLHVKGWTNGYAITAQSPTTGTAIFQVESENSGATPVIAGTLRLAKGVNNRSVNASGTLNANGADYAEYMLKAGDFTITKGDICGINANGKLVKTFSEAVAFVVKSTNPSYVGNDNWFTEQRPCDENEKESLKDSEEFKVWENRMEAARQLVDRIAFCGQVPVNVLGAAPGQWIIPVEDNGGIKGEAVSNPSFEQYQKAVGKVIAVEADGRARIIVKIA